MKRAFIVLSGSVLGVSLGVLLGACGGYFECDTIHHRIVAGTYVQTSLELALDANRQAVVTHRDNEGAEVRAVYTVAPERQTPVPH